jgi:hypothetical protein
MADENGYEVVKMVPDGLADLAQAEADGRAAYNKAKGFDRPPPVHPPREPMITLGDRKEQCGTLVQWPPWQSQCRLVLATIPYALVPEVHEALSQDDAFLIGEVPYVVLGECRITFQRRREPLPEATRPLSLEEREARALRAVSEVEHYVPQDTYSVRQAALWTLAFRPRQIEEDHKKFGPGLLHRELVRTINELQARVGNGNEAGNT